MAVSFFVSLFLRGSSILSVIITSRIRETQNIATSLIVFPRFDSLLFIFSGELFSHMRNAGHLSDDATRFYISELVLVLQYLHGRRIAYRDLKPENIIIDRQGHVKVTDFGFAKHMKDGTSTMCGTPEYLAPEIIRGEPYDERVDWWALGILMYEMLVGYPPFFDDVHDNPLNIYTKILAGKVCHTVSGIVG